MQEITSTLSLKKAIQQLEVDREFEGLQLKKDFQSALKNLNPFNILKGTLEKATSTPLLFDNIIGTTLGLATGFLTKKIIIGKSHNKLKVLLGSIIEYGVLNFIGQRAVAIKSISVYLIQSLIRKKEHQSN